MQISDIPFLSQPIKHHPCFKAITIASILTASWKFYKITNSTFATSNFIVVSDKTIYLPFIKMEKYLSIAPDTEFWTQICKIIHLMIKNVNLQTIQYKTLHIIHYTGRRMAKMGFSSEICPYCSQNTPDTYVHAMWNCTPMKHFWKKVTESLSGFLGCFIP